MSILSLSPQSLNAEPKPRRFARAVLWHALVEGLTWLVLIGMVSTISAGRSGSSSYTLAVAAAGIAVSFIRRGSTNRLTFFAAVVELLTLFLVTGVAGNPALNHLRCVIAVLAAWVVVEVIRTALWQPTTVVSAFGRLAILFAFGVAIDGRALWPAVLPTALIVSVWAAAELAWCLVVRALAQRRPFNARLTRRQVTVVTTVCITTLVLFIASAVVNYTTVQVHGQTLTMQSVYDRWPEMYCITYPWKILGLNISQIGFAGTTECFDTEAELRQVATHEWVGRRGFSDER